MKKIITGLITIGLIVAFNTTLFSAPVETYEAITLDNTVQTKGEVQVQRVKLDGQVPKTRRLVENETLSLNFIDNRIDRNNEAIQIFQDRISALQIENSILNDKRGKVNSEAVKVVLKP